MTQTMTAHFDGKVIVPDEPVQLPVGQPLQVTVVTEPANGRRPRQLGTMKGTVRFVAADFDAPLDEFREYME